MTHLDHDHRKGENIRLRAAFRPTIQDFWRGPSRETDRVSTDRGKTDVRDPCVTVGINEDIGLCRRKKVIK